MSDSSKHKPSLKKGIAGRIFYFFPFQLVFLHIKRNQLLLLFWLILYLLMTGVIGKSYGIPYLFLAPEYLGQVNFLSFAILGFSIGGFIMAFNIYSYIIYASEFQFLATLSRPFIKFCYNNHIIPFIFVITLFFKAYAFQVDEELISYAIALWNLFGLGLGILLFLIISTLYFVRFNKNVHEISGKDASYFQNLLASGKEATLIKKIKWYQRIGRKQKWRVDTYMGNLTKIKMARRSDHYDKELLKKVFKQNHINASFFEIVLIVSFIIFGLFRDIDWVIIPAGASIFLIFTIFLLLFSALYSWFKGWTLTIVILGLMVFNYASKTYDMFNFTNYAYGIDYQKKASYSYDSLRKLASNKKNYDKSYSHTIQILENWKKKNMANTEVKPKMVIFNISGGGLRSGLWTMSVITKIDSITNGKLLKQTQLITGASGGMIGASYLRELYLQSLTDRSINLSDPKYLENICKDLLNPMAFSIATTDFFIRYQKVYNGPYIYSKDRGYFFEQKLIENLGVFKNKKLFEYYLPEKEAQIPMVIFSPSITNDGRRMLISPQPISYLTYIDTAFGTSTYSSLENIEYSELLKDNNAMNLDFTTAIRMNATFPYVLPMVSLPTEPPIELMDAGLRDNYGLKTSLEFIRAFKDWITENTSGIIIVEIRDKQKYFEVKNVGSGSIMQRLFTPFASVYGNILKTHDYNNDQLLKNALEWFPGKMDVVSFYLNQDENQEISMSFHLTELDKKKIISAFNSKDNQNSLERLLELIKR